MPLAAGQTLCHYEILGPLGAGGMGEVYRARDTRLERQVAIKVLPESFADDEARLRRFEREAKILASLNHPNIAAIHEVDQHEGRYFLALELVPGVDLATRLSRGALPVDESLDLCRQIAEGLEAAHEAGVVHRDLKPGNVRITPDGVAKVLDFGLAKQSHPGTSVATPDSMSLTESGGFLGTPAYTSPEQARGRPVDRRTDVWAFGCVLYECLTGKRAFPGRTLAEILGAVLERDWDRSALPASTPPRVRALLERCLEKDPRSRLRDVGEARVVLERGERKVDPSRAVGGGRALPLALGCSVVAVALGATWGRWTAPVVPGPVRSVRIEPLTVSSRDEESPALSPDGQKLAFVRKEDGHARILVRSLAESEERPVAGDANPGTDQSHPRWLDDETLLYLAEDALWETRVDGSQAPRNLGPAQGEADASRRGRIATFVREKNEVSLVVMERDGAAAERRSLPSGDYRAPRWSPDGGAIAYLVNREGWQPQVQILDLATDSTTTFGLLGDVQGITWIPDGSGLVYAPERADGPRGYCLRLLHLADGADTSLSPPDGELASYSSPDIAPMGRFVACRIQSRSSDVYCVREELPPQNRKLSGQMVPRAALARRIPEEVIAAPDELHARLEESRALPLLVERVERAQLVEMPEYRRLEQAADLATRRGAMEKAAIARELPSVDVVLLEGLLP